MCETMPCVDDVFMYSMLVVAGDSWWSMPLYVQLCVQCGHTHLRFSFKLMPVLDLKWKHLSSRITILQTDDFPKFWMSHTFQYSRTKMPSRRSIGL